MNILTQTQIDFLHNCIRYQYHPFDNDENSNVALRIIANGYYTDQEQTLLNMWMKWYRIFKSRGELWGTEY